MSYPLTIQALIVEDDEKTKEMYEEIFEALTKDLSCLPFRFAPPLFAFSYQRAHEFLAGSKMFHLVILDLRLPENDRIAESEKIDFGQALLRECLERERFPIPSLLVISGHINKTEQDNFQNSVRTGFYHGRVFVKQDYQLIQAEIRKACDAALQYCAVGVHLRDDPGKLFPTLSAREDDLLRRSVLQQPGAIGLDIAWWNAEPETGEYRDAGPWKKVFIGRYLFTDGVGPSRPRFFKFMPRSGAENVILGARRLEQKLYHIKVLSEVLGEKRALLVTEKVGASEERPISLESFFWHPDCSSSGISRVAGQIIEQLEALGDLQPASKALNRLFWPHHNKTALKEQWTRFSGPQVAIDLGASIDCLEAALQLMDSTEIMRFDQRSCTHGDLNIGNVALDVQNLQMPNAYIFDAGNNTREIAGKDIAVLEVSALLHQVHKNGLDFVRLCKFLYGGHFIPTENEIGQIGSISRATLQFILELRSGLRDTVSPYVYALLILDYAAIQLEGLRYTSGNKIRDPLSAVTLFAAVSDWCAGQRACVVSASL
jgi:CheY-like chemotaxis protein